MTTQQPQMQQPAQPADDGFDANVAAMLAGLQAYNDDPGKFEREAFEKSKSIIPVVQMPEGWEPSPLNPDGSLKESGH